MFRFHNGGGIDMDAFDQGQMIIAAASFGRPFTVQCLNQASQNMVATVG